jgi:malonyl-CoA/methylmalonyl-CoA synthetase
MSENLYDILAARFPADRAQPCFIRLGEAAISYGDLEVAVAQTAGHLVRKGVGAGDRVALQAPKTWQAVAVYLATLKAGAVFLPLNTAYTPSEVEYFLADAEPALFLTDAEAFVAEAADAPPLETAVACSASDLAAIIYTSGTTGRSKGAMLTHGALTANALALHEAWGFSPDDVLLHALPIFHVHGLFVALHCAFLSGCPMVWLARFEDDAVLEGLAKSTVMMGVPTFYTRLLANPGFTRERASHMRLFVPARVDLPRVRRAYRPAHPRALRHERGGDHHHQPAAGRAHRRQRRLSLAGRGTADRRRGRDRRHRDSRAQRLLRLLAHARKDRRGVHRGRFLRHGRRRPQGP